MLPLAHFLDRPVALELGAHGSGPALLRTFLQVDAGGSASIVAFHLDPEGSWLERAEGAALAQARNEDEMLAAAEEIQFPSGLPVVVNRFDQLARQAEPWLAQLG